MRTPLVNESQPQDIKALEAALDEAERDARTLVSGLGEEIGAWRAGAGSWSVAECLDHLAIANRVYLRAMQPAAERAVRKAADDGVRPDRVSSEGGSFARWSRRSSLA